MTNTIFYFLLFVLPLNLIAQQQIDPNNIEIYRDDYGIPHIFTKTNQEAVYGIAWAQCEDNFNLIQESFSANKNLGGRVLGKDGAILDFIYKVFDIETFVDKRYEKDITQDIEKFLTTYVNAINKYAETHPEEVKKKKLFPVTEKELLGTYMLQYSLTHTTVMEIGKLLTKDFDYTSIEQIGKGSNAFAYSPNKTKDNKSYLIGNPHQPVNGFGNFWELSVHSEEGYEFYGVTFSVGGVFPVIGVNRNLGWTHTTNYHNSADIYKLEMHPTQKDYYKYDGEWIPLKKEKAKLKVKLGFITIPVSKKYYTSVYGPTFKKESGYYSIKLHSYNNVKAIEQWYKMGLAKNIEEFEEALDIQGLPSQTITYADKEGNIMHLSNFSHPYRNEKYDWSGLENGNKPILPGNTSESNWPLDKIYPVNALPQVKNPACGYVYNCNNTVFKMTAPEENLVPEDFPKHFGLLKSNTIRANIFENEIKKHDKISFEEARDIRENVSIDKENLSFRNCTNCSDISLIISKYPELSQTKDVFSRWNGEFSIDNPQASIMSLTIMYIEDYIKEQFGNIEKDVPEEVIFNAVHKAQKFLLSHYGKLEVPLGEIQKAVRFDTETPIYGNVLTLANSHFKPYKKGKIKLVHGDSYIFYAKYDENGLEELHTINAFGNSNKENSKHSTDQTSLYFNMQTRKAELDLENLKNQSKPYHPK